MNCDSCDKGEQEVDFMAGLEDRHGVVKFHICEHCIGDLNGFAAQRMNRSKRNKEISR